MTTAQEVEDWRVKIKKKIWSEFAAEPNEAHGKFLMKKFDELCDTALFGISINSQTAEQVERLAIAVAALQSISEYWRCARTMTDACEHNRNAAAEALAQIEGSE